jgi:hypothetical protein
VEGVEPLVGLVTQIGEEFSNHSALSLCPEEVEVRVVSLEFSVKCAGAVISYRYASK